MPISSSGHLAIAQHFLPGFHQPGILLDVLLHFGTLVAVVVYFRRDLLALALTLRGKKPNPLSAGDGRSAEWRLLVGLAVACLPTAALGLLLEERVEKWFESLFAVGAALIGTALLLAGAEAAARRRGKKPAGSPGPQEPGIGQSLLIGLFQGVAVVPGLSRSGATISAGVISGVEGVTATRFSFLLSLPAVGGATLLTVLKHREELRAAGVGDFAGYVLGPLAAGVVGYACIGLMMRLMQKARLSYFAVYCAIVGGLAMACQWLGL